MAWSCDVYRFEPTYKELKQSLVVLLPYLPLCFEPTYKELKHHITLIPLHTQVGFEPTYKELKLPCSQTQSPMVEVLSLPIRN